MTVFILTISILLNNAQMHHHNPELHFSKDACVTSALTWKKRLDPHTQYPSKLTCTEVRYPLHTA